MNGLGSIVERIHRCAQTESGSTRPPRVVYLRRKPGKGLVVRYATVGASNASKASKASNASGTSWTALVPEDALRDDAHRRRSIVAPCPPGLMLLPFPCDPALPDLANALAPATDDGCRRVLLTAFRVALDDDAAELVTALPTCVRYKPGERCVVRYELEGRGRAGGDARVSVYGKMFADRDDATSAWAIACQLHEATDRGAPAVPRPLAMADGMHLVLTESAGANGQSGADVLRPERASEADLVATGASLAWLHSIPATVGLPTRLVSTLAGQTRRRAALLAATHRSVAADLMRTGDIVAEALVVVRLPERAVFTHGAFKPSQLVFVSGRPVVTDFDGAAAGDPAYDVGYLRAYLRPPGCWGRRAAAREWFALARETVTEAYLGAVDRVATAPSGGDLRRRASIVEAAILFKIGARRVNRLQAPRPNEVRAMLADIAQCLAQAGA